MLLATQPRIVVILFLLNSKQQQCQQFAFVRVSLPLARFMVIMAKKYYFANVCDDIESVYFFHKCHFVGERSL